MPRPVKTSIEKWKNESESTFSDNVTALLDTFGEFKLLYPELGKYPDEIGPFEVALDYMEDFWIVSLNVLNGDVSDDWAKIEDEEKPAFYEPALSSRELRQTMRGAGRGGQGEVGLGNLGLKNFPLIGPLSDGAAKLEVNHASSGRAGGGSDLGLPAFNGSENGSNAGASSVGFPNVVSSASSDAKPRIGVTSTGLDDLDLGFFDQVENTAAIQHTELPPRTLPELDNPEDQHYDDAARHRLANGIKEQHVIGLAFATPSTIHIPDELHERQLRNDNGDESLGAGPRAKRARLMDLGPKSYDIGILLKFDEIREKILSTCGQLITDEMEEGLTQDAIFNLLIDLEPTLDVCGVFQFQVLIVPGWEQSHDRLLSAFLKMWVTNFTLFIH